MRRTLTIGGAALAALMAALVQTQPPSPAGEHPPATQPEQPGFTPPDPPAAGEHARDRAAMVQRQIASPLDNRTPVRDKAVLDAMRTVPRHAFVPPKQRSRAYQDTPLPIGHTQTISQPYIVALMTELLEIDPEAQPKILEIGTGSGYQAAVLGQLTPNVYTIEIIEPLGRRAEKTLRDQVYTNVKCRRTDGYYGWPEEAPFDAIIVTCAAGHLPPPLWKQLKPGGRIVIPIGGPYETQRLVLMTKQPDGSRRSQTVLGVRFVPMTRESQQ